MKKPYLKAINLKFGRKYLHIEAVDQKGVKKAQKCPMMDDLDLLMVGKDLKGKMVSMWVQRPNSAKLKALSGAKKRGRPRKSKRSRKHAHELVFFGVILQWPWAVSIGTWLTDLVTRPIL